MLYTCLTQISTLPAFNFRHPVAPIPPFQAFSGPHNGLQASRLHNLNFTNKKHGKDCCVGTSTSRRKKTSIHCSGYIVRLYDDYYWFVDHPCKHVHWCSSFFSFSSVVVIWEEGFPKNYSQSVKLRTPSRNYTASLGYRYYTH